MKQLKLALLLATFPLIAFADSEMESHDMEAVPTIADEATPLSPEEQKLKNEAKLIADFQKETALLSRGQLESKLQEITFETRQLDLKLYQSQESLDAKAFQLLVPLSPDGKQDALNIIMLKDVKRQIELVKQKLNSPSEGKEAWKTYLDALENFVAQAKPVLEQKHRLLQKYYSLNLALQKNARDANRLKLNPGASPGGVSIKPRSLIFKPGSNVNPSRLPNPARAFGQRE